MKKIFKAFIYFLFFVLFLLIFLPKESIYNLLENELANQKVIISNESRDEKLFALDIKEAKIYYEGIEGVNINKINIFSLLVYSKIEFYDISLLESLSSFFPSKIKSIDFQHSLLDYKNINFKSKGDFGLASGQINLVSRLITLNLEASKLMKKKYSKLLRTMKLKEGKYVYEYRF